MQISTTGNELLLYLYSTDPLGWWGHRQAELRAYRLYTQGMSMAPAPKSQTATSYDTAGYQSADWGLRSQSIAWCEAGLNTDGTAEVVSYSDYYPFGMMMPGRT